MKIRKLISTLCAVSMLVSVSSAFSMFASAETTTPKFVVTQVGEYDATNGGTLLVSLVDYDKAIRAKASEISGMDAFDTTTLGDRATLGNFDVSVGLNAADFEAASLYTIDNRSGAVNSVGLTVDTAISNLALSGATVASGVSLLDENGIGVSNPKTDAESAKTISVTVAFAMDGKSTKAPAESLGFDFSNIPVMTLTYKLKDGVTSSTPTIIAKACSGYVWSSDYSVEQQIVFNSDSIDEECDTLGTLGDTITKVGDKVYKETDDEGNEVADTTDLAVAYTVEKTLEGAYSKFSVTGKFTDTEGNKVEKTSKVKDLEIAIPNTEANVVIGVIVQIDGSQYTDFELTSLDLQ